MFTVPPSTPLGPKKMSTWMTLACCPFDGVRTAQLTKRCIPFLLICKYYALYTHMSRMRPSRGCEILKGYEVLKTNTSTVMDTCRAAGSPFSCCYSCRFATATATIAYSLGYRVHGTNNVAAILLVPLQACRQLGHTDHSVEPV
jgi:hypothetical protein